MTYRTLLNGSTTTPQGFSAAAVAAGIKQSGRPDMVLLISDRYCTAAGVFTSNQVAAAPVIIDRETLAANNSTILGVVINSGNANACTGAPGLANAREMQTVLAEALGGRQDQYLVMSTGVIGVPLPMERVRSGILAAAPSLSPAQGIAAATGIMTTDTRPKFLAIEVQLSGGKVTLGGMAKGAGMIHPNMATLLGVLTTDAAVPPDDLAAMLREAVHYSFNAISIDGDTSTNDTVLILANGASGAEVSDAVDREQFLAALNELCRALALKVVSDGEGVTKVVTLRITGAKTEYEARQVANTIATSPLVKTAFAGGDPNWGRIVAAAGRSGVIMDQNALALWVSAEGGPPLEILRNGTPTNFTEAAAAALFAQPAFTVHLDLGNGSAETTMWTTDLTHEYVTINADYRT